MRPKDRPPRRRLLRKRLRDDPAVEVKARSSRPTRVDKAIFLLLLLLRPLLLLLVLTRLPTWRFVGFFGFVAFHTCVFVD